MESLGQQAGRHRQLVTCVGIGCHCEGLGIVSRTFVFYHMVGLVCSNIGCLWLSCLNINSYIGKLFVFEFLIGAALFVKKSMRIQ